MLLKAQDLNLKKKDFFKEKIILLYGENQDLIKDLNKSEEHTSELQSH